MLEERDLAMFSKTILTGIVVGVGSLVLIFANPPGVSTSSPQVIIQCPFECIDHGTMHLGHGEQIASSTFLFLYLNKSVLGAEFGADHALILTFEGEKLLRIIPESNVPESYVVSTSLGICPVSGLPQNSDHRATL